MNEISVVVKLSNGSLMGATECDENPPIMSSFRILSPRTCPNCTIEKTVWWALAMEGKSLEDLSKRQIEVLTRINNEPLSILPNSDDGLSS